MSSNFWRKYFINLAFYHGYFRPRFGESNSTNNHKASHFPINFHNSVPRLAARNVSNRVMNGPTNPPHYPAPWFVHLAIVEKVST